MHYRKHAIFLYFLLVKFGSWAHPNGHITQFSALKLCRKTDIQIALWTKQVFTRQIGCFISIVPIYPAFCGQYIIHYSCLAGDHFQYIASVTDSCPTWTSGKERIICAKVRDSESWPLCCTICYIYIINRTRCRLPYAMYASRSAWFATTKLLHDLCIYVCLVYVIMCGSRGGGEAGGPDPPGK